jgi:hypothetical protein
LGGGLKKNTLNLEFRPKRGVRVGWPNRVRRKALFLNPSSRICFIVIDKALYTSKFIMEFIYFPQMGLRSKILLLPS